MITNSYATYKLLCNKTQLPQCATLVSFTNIVKTRETDFLCILLRYVLCVIFKFIKCMVYDEGTFNLIESCMYVLIKEIISKLTNQANLD